MNGKKKKPDFSIVDPSRITIFEQGYMNILLFLFRFCVCFLFLSSPFSDSLLKKWHNRIIERETKNANQYILYAHILCFEEAV